MKLPEVAVKRPVAITMLFIAVLLFGVVSLTRLPLDIMPDMELPTLTVITVYPGASASEVEQQITKELEMILSGTENLKNISSQSKENVSFVQLQFDWGADITSGHREPEKHLLAKQGERFVCPAPIRLGCRYYLGSQ